jgi:hypothetical protein
VWVQVPSPARREREIAIISLFFLYTYVKIAAGAG